VNGDRIDLLEADVAPEVMRELQELDTSKEWRGSVSDLYTSSFRRSVRAVRPRLVRTSVTCQPAIVSLLRERRRDIQERYGVVMQTPSDSANTIEIASPYAPATEEAATALRELDGLPRVFAVLPPNTAGRVLGKEHAHRRQLEAQGGVRWVWVDGDRVGVIGDSDRAVEHAVQAIRAAVESATGELVVPPGKNGLLIGTKGATIKRLKDSTGCQAHNPNKGERWIIDGPTETAVREFMRLATQIVGGTSRSVSSRQLRIVEDTRTRRRGVRAATESRAAKPGWCFIATACYGDSEHPDVVVLRRWRDRELLRSSTGQLFVRVYYRLSPAVAKFLVKQKVMARMLRVLLLQPMVRLIRRYL